MLTATRRAARALLRAPGFSLLVVACLALGIGVNVAFLAVVDMLLYRPPAGVHAPQTLYRVEAVPVFKEGQQFFVAVELSPGDVERIGARRDVFARLASYADAREVSIGQGATARQARAALTGDGYFEVLGARPALGRLLIAADQAPGAARVMVLGHALWRAAFGGDSAIVGRDLVMNGLTFRVVGVTAPRFAGIDAAAPDVWLPLPGAVAAGYPKSFLDQREARWLKSIARLAPGVSPARATGVLTAMLNAAPKGETPFGDGERAGGVSPATSRYGGEVQGSPPVPAWVLAATAAVLLVACANVANLLLARGERRRRELATRAALGAGRGALARMLLTETALLAVAGGALGLLLAHYATRLFARLPNMPPLDHVLDARAAMGAVAVTIAATLLAGLAPALRGTHVEPTVDLRSGARTLGGRSRLRSALMAGQLAVALVLLSAAGALVRSLQEMRTVDTGFDLAHTAVVHVNLERAGMSGAEAEAFAEQVATRLRAMPGVRSAARAAVTPFDGLMFSRLEVPGVKLPEKAIPGMQIVNQVGPGYFATIGLPLVRGRAIDSADVATKAKRTVVSAALAKAAWGDADPIGRCVRMDDACHEVVGVVANAAIHDLSERDGLMAYTPLAPWKDARTMRVVLRAEGDPGRLAQAARAVVQGMDPRLPYVGAMALRDAPSARSQLAPFELGATAFSAFGLLALLVAAVGLYAVVAYAVAQRTGEFGVRLALGADERALARLVLGEGLRHVATGGAIGLAGAVGVTHLLRSRLYGVSPYDPTTFVVAALVLVAAMLVACWLPARRAARIHPTQALRYE